MMDSVEVSDVFENNDSYMFVLEAYDGVACLKIKGGKYLNALFTENTFAYTDTCQYKYFIESQDADSKTLVDEFGHKHIFRARIHVEVPSDTVGELTSATDYIPTPTTDLIVNNDSLPIQTEENFDMIEDFMGTNDDDTLENLGNTANDEEILASDTNKPEETLPTMSETSIPEQTLLDQPPTLIPSSELSSDTTALNTDDNPITASEEHGAESIPEVLEPAITQADEAKQAETPAIMPAKSVTAVDSFIGKTIFLKSYHGTTLGANSDYSTYLGDNQLGWEEFEFIPASDGKVFIRSKQWNAYLSARNDNSIRLMANPLGWEEWIPEAVEGKYQFKSVWNTYLRADPARFPNQAQVPQGWERWEILVKREPVPASTPVDQIYNTPLFIKSYHGTYLGAGNGGSVNLNPRTQGWEEWMLIPQGGDQVAIKNINFNNYLSARAGGAISNVDWVQGWEIWTVSRAGHKFVFRSYHGTYLRADPAGFANQASVPQGWEEWEIYLK